MKTYIFLPLFLLISLYTFSTSQPTFKEAQLKFSRVRDTYKNQGEWMLTLLKSKNISVTNLKIKIYIDKSDETVIVKYIPTKGTESELTSFKICAMSGEKGTKCKEGDEQTPEGDYYIDRFNPQSNFHMSLGINYPNKSDLVKCGCKSYKGMGGDIFIHGNCVTIGCVPITDKYIEQLYILCIEAYNNGERRIPVHIEW
jgi:murein L,D-transpeptidase YafK